MTKFEEELSNLPVSKSTNYTEFWNKAQLLTVFKDWQPQQALPVVPEDVAKWIEDLKSKGYSPLKNPVTYGESISDLSDESLEKILTWISQHQEEFMRAWLDGFKVEKPQLFYLKHIDMSKNDEQVDWYMSKAHRRVGHNACDKEKLPIYDSFKYTQQEIDSMQTGSYEQIKVEDH
ncbi:DUF1642 domain-containing protein [Lactococcus cremoris]|uniref:DUF1642 domain-containing protein n=1 Tax=Lactococcus lactis subsp. cremoris TaxID=1359 RepID=UPI0003AB5E07|nr:DUF1642 domain-containing protein [Lactococcus cremoris]AGV73773.1 phage-related protein [Lactococcus cremoris subsp. cremoris KW2]